MNFEQFSKAIYEAIHEQADPKDTGKQEMLLNINGYRSRIRLDGGLWHYEIELDSSLNGWTYSKAGAILTAIECLLSCHPAAFAMPQTTKIPARRRQAKKGRKQ